MWALIWFFQGAARVRLLGGSPEWALSRLVRNSVAVRRIKRTDAFCIELTILRKDLAAAQTLASAASCELTVLNSFGFQSLFGGLFKRPVLLSLLALSMALILYLPRFVFFYEVSGNETIPSALILRELQNVGVGFGTYGPSIKPQQVKNKMLLRIPALQWITVQQHGMRAVVVVRERTKALPVLDRKTPQDVIASADGILTTVRTLDGNCLVSPGQAVTKGQTLVSAYTDFGYKTSVTAALAEIYALTRHECTVVLPQTESCKLPCGRAHREISLLCGKKRLKIFGNSGIPDGSCDKITSYRYLTLPGGLTLPVGLAIETQTPYERQPISRTRSEAEQDMKRFSDESTKSGMIAGKILSDSRSFSAEDGKLVLRSVYVCEEMIARMVQADVKDGIPNDRTEYQRGAGGAAN